MVSTTTSTKGENNLKSGYMFFIIETSLKSRTCSANEKVGWITLCMVQSVYYVFF